MKILLACVHFHSSFGWSIEQALLRAGHAVRIFEYRRPPVRGIPGFPRLWSSRWMPAALLSACRNFRPDLLFIAKGETIPGKTLETVRRECRCRMVNWFPDARLFSFGTVLTQLPLLDILFSKNTEDLDRLRLVGFSNGRFLQHAADRQLHVEFKTGEEMLRPYRCQVAMIGSYYPYREALLSQLGDFDLRIWGGGWERSALASRNPQAVMRREARSFEQTCVFRGAGVNVNTHHFDDVNSLNQRVLDIAGSGGCQLVDGNRPLEAIFGKTGDVAIFRSLEELREKVSWLLDHPETARAMGESCRRMISSAHTYDHRILEILSLLP